MEAPRSTEPGTSHSNDANAPSREIPLRALLNRLILLLMVVLTEVFGPSVPAPDLSTARQPRQFAFPFALLPSAASTSQSPFRYTSARLNPAFAYYNFGYQRSAFAPIPSWARLLSTSSGLGPNLSVGQQSTTAGPSAPATSFFLPRSASDVFVRVGWT